MEEDPEWNDNYKWCPYCGWSFDPCRSSCPTCGYKKDATREDVVCSKCGDRIHDLILNQYQIHFSHV